MTVFSLSVSAAWAAGAPAAVTGLAASGVTSSSLTVTWTGDGVATSTYDAKITEGAVAASCAGAASVGHALTKTFTHLHAGKVYTVSVCEKPAKGSLSAPAEVQATTTAVPAVTIQNQNVTDTSAVITWTSPGAEVTTYVVDFAASPATATCAKGALTQALSLTKPVRAGASYSLQICARDAQGDLSAPTSVTFTAPSVPTPATLVASSVTNTAATLSWTPGPGDIAGFRISIGAGGTAPNCAKGIPLAASVNTYNLKALSPGSTYTIGVCSYDSAKVFSAPMTTVINTNLSPDENVTTFHNDPYRTGQNPYEKSLARSNVNTSSFGKIGALPVDGLVYAQPLYASNVSGKNLVLVATEHDSVYAYDADSLSTTPVWHRSFLGDSFKACNNCNTLTYIQVGAPNIVPEIGITATPVIDLAKQVIYVIATTEENGTIFIKLHALSLATGADLPNSPTVIEPSLPGKVDPNAQSSPIPLKQHEYAYGTTSDGLIHFDPLRQLPRAGLVLTNGTVYTAMSSFNDQEPVHGWVIGYNATTLKQQSAWMTTEHSGDGDIWMSGDAPVVDGFGNLFFASGNGDATLLSGLDLADSVVKLRKTAAGLETADYFTPYDWIHLANQDVDLGSGGVMALPDQPGAHPHLIMAGGKEGTIYLLNRDDLGKRNNAAGATSDPQIVQELIHAVPGGTNYGPGIYSTPAYFSGKVFLVGSGDFLRSIPVVNGLLDWSGMSVSNEKDVLRGGTVSISSNGPADGIAWYLDASAYTYNFSVAGYATRTNGPTILCAYSTDDLSKPLYRSDMVAADAAGYAVKFAVPTVAAGKVFVGTDTELSVYGLKNSVAAAAKAGTRTIASVTNNNFSDMATGSSPLPTGYWFTTQEYARKQLRKVGNWLLEITK